MKSPGDGATASTRLTDQYNQVQSEIARQLGSDKFYKMLPSGEMELSSIPDRDYTIGIDWEPENKRGCAAISCQENIIATIQIAAQSKFEFDKIVKSISESYGATVIKEK
jgi:hypothetical protein